MTIVFDKLASLQTYAEKIETELNENKEEMASKISQQKIEAIKIKEKLEHKIKMVQQGF